MNSTVTNINSTLMNKFSELWLKSKVRYLHLETSFQDIFNITFS